MAEERDLGIQPLADLMDQWGLNRHDLVAVSPEQLTHKQVQRAVHGRLLTLKMRQKLARSLNFAIWGRLKDDERQNFTEYTPKHLFNYAKGFENGESINSGVTKNLANRVVRSDFWRELGIAE